MFSIKKILILPILLGGCSLLAQPIENGVAPFPKQWTGYFDVKDKGESSFIFFHSLIKIDSDFLYTKKVSLDFETGKFHSVTGEVYTITEVKKNEAREFQAVLKTVLAASDTDTYAFGIRYKNETNITSPLWKPKTNIIETDEIQLISPITINTGSSFEAIIDSKITLYKDFIKADDNIVIPDFPIEDIPIVDPDTDTRPFLEKIGEKGNITNINGYTLKYAYWILTPNMESHVAGWITDMIVGVKPGSKIVLYDSCLRKSDGSIYKYTPDYGGTAEKVYGYIYRDDDPTTPRYPLHFTPINHKIGVYWFQGNGLLDFKKAGIPIMIAGDISMSGLFTMTGDKNSSPVFNNKKHIDYFEGHKLETLLTANNLLQRIDIKNVPNHKPIPDKLL